MTPNLISAGCKEISQTKGEIRGGVSDRGHIQEVKWLSYLGLRFIFMWSAWRFVQVLVTLVWQSWSSPWWFHSFGSISQGLPTGSQSAPGSIPLFFATNLPCQSPTLGRLYQLLFPVWFWVVLQENVMQISQMAPLKTLVNLIESTLFWFGFYL